MIGFVCPRNGADSGPSGVPDSLSPSSPFCSAVHQRSLWGVVGVGSGAQGGPAEPAVLSCFVVFIYFGVDVSLLVTDCHLEFLEDLVWRCCRVFWGVFKVFVVFGAVVWCR